MKRIGIAFACSLLTLLALPASAAMELFFIHNDHLGTPRVITNQAQQVVWKGHVKPFGAMEVEIESITNHRRFPGQRFDIESRLHYNYFRDYDPTTGRYIQSDPIGLVGGFNVYAYANGNPLIYYDPYGLWALGDPLPQSLVDGAAGFGDGLTAGSTDYIREQLGINGPVNQCSSAYSGSQFAGAASALGLGGGRLLYAGLARGYSATASSGAAASAFRSRLRRAFGGGGSLRPPNLSRYSYDAALRNAAGRTNPYANAAGAAAAFGGASGLGADSCECSR